MFFRTVTHRDILQNPALGAFFAPPYLIARALQNAHYQALSADQQHEMNNRIGGTALRFFRPETAPLLSAEQLLFTARVSHITRTLRLFDSLIAYAIPDHARILARASKSLEEQRELARRDVGQLPAEWPEERGMYMRQHAVELAEQRHSSGFEAALIPVLQRLQTGTFFEQLQALIQALELQVSRSDFLEDTGGVLRLECALGIRDGNLQTLAQRKEAAEKLGKFVKALLALFKPTVPYSQDHNLFGMFYSLALRVQAVRASLIPVETGSELVLFEDFRTALQAPTDLPADITDLVEEYHYSITDVLPVINADVRRLPPEWRNRLEVEGSSSTADAPLALTFLGCDLSFSKLSAIAQACGRAAHLQVNVIGASVSENDQIPLIALQHIFGADKITRQNTIGATQTHASNPLQEIMRDRGDMGLSEEEAWTLYVLLHNEDASRCPPQGSVEHQEWRRNEQKKMLQFLEGMRQTLQTP